MNEQPTIMFKKFETGCQNYRFSKGLHVFHLKKYLLGVWSKARVLPASDLIKWHGQWIFEWVDRTTV